MDNSETTPNETKSPPVKKFSSFARMFFFANLSEICYNIKDATNKELMGSRGVSLASIALLSALLNLVIICLTRLCSG